jgi:hypothetical protein
MNLPKIPYLPIAVVVLGLYFKSKPAIWIGGVWLALDVALLAGGFNISNVLGNNAGLPSSSAPGAAAVASSAVPATTTTPSPQVAAMNAASAASIVRAAG